MPRTIQRAEHPDGKSFQFVKSRPDQSTRHYFQLPVGKLLALYYTSKPWVMPHSGLCGVS